MRYYFNAHIIAHFCHSSAHTTGSNLVQLKWNRIAAHELGIVFTRPEVAVQGWQTISMQITRARWAHIPKIHLTDHVMLATACGNIRLFQVQRLDQHQCINMRLLGGQEQPQIPQMCSYTAACRQGRSAVQWQTWNMQTRKTQFPWANYPSDNVILRHVRHCTIMSQNNMPTTYCSIVLIQP